MSFILSKARLGSISYNSSLITGRNNISSVPKAIMAFYSTPTLTEAIFILLLAERGANNSLLPAGLEQRRQTYRKM